MDAIRKEKLEVNKQRLQQERLDAFCCVKNSVQNSNDDITLRNVLLQHEPATDLKLTFQHLGGVVCTMQNGRKKQFVTVLMTKADILSISNRQGQEQEENFNNVSNTNQKESNQQN